MAPALVVLISVLVLGTFAQWIAWRIKVPSILLLLAFGFIVGPVTGFLEPDALFGELLFPWVSLSVAIILFEGGLTLRISELEKIGTVVRNLVSVGILITWVLSSSAAYFFLDMQLSLSILLGAILVVTGPTVIMPMLRTMKLSSKLSSTLKWEAMLNDPIGAILAVLVFEAILVGGLGAATNFAVIGLVKTIVVGLGLGLLTSTIIKELFKRYWVPDFLQNAFTLMMVTAAYGLSNMLQEESGLVAVTISGLMLANQKEIMVKHIIEFKENLRVLLISSLFIVLGARLDFGFVTHLGFGHLAFVAFLFFVVRPVTVFVSTIGSDLKFNEKLLLSWLCPRGIVAAAVASIFALKLEAAGYPRAEELVSVTFLVIVSTVLIYGITGPWVAGLLKLAQPNSQGLVIAGAHDWAVEIALALKEKQFPVLMIDTNSLNVRKARARGVSALRRDILGESVLDELDLSGIGRFLAMTQNDEVNSLGAILFSEIFSRSDIYQLVSNEKETNTEKKVQGRQLFRETLSFDALEVMFEHGAKVESFEFSEGFTYEDFKDEHEDNAYPLFIISESGKELRPITTEQVLAPKAGQVMIALLKEEVLA